MIKEAAGVRGGNGAGPGRKRGGAGRGAKAGA